jgi:hypothetical protein
VKALAEADVKAQAEADVGHWQKRT